jgi:hypothetical protein
MVVVAVFGSPLTLLEFWKVFEILEVFIDSKVWQGYVSDHGGCGSPLTLLEFWKVFEILEVFIDSKVWQGYVSDRGGSDRGGCDGPWQSFDPFAVLKSVWDSWSVYRF